MAVSINVGEVVREIRNIVGDLRDAQRAEKEKYKAAQLLVYKTLAIHPALEYMRPPTGILGDMDWYTDLRSPFSKGIFRRLGQNEHFKRTSMLGETGTRARIMMLLLWILGHRLSEDHISKLISTAIGDALPKEEAGNLLEELQQLNSVKKVLVDLRKMMKTKLPLPSDRNPFLGKDYRIEDEEKALPRTELWGYNLPPAEQYEYDARRNPSVLLSRLDSRIIIPQNKITLLLIQWTTSNFGLGKKVYSREDIDPAALWNADPPFTEEDTRPSTPDSDFAFEVWDGIESPPYDYPFQDLPLDDFLHLRYCHNYRVHGWVHDSLSRSLLFNAFCGTQQLPSDSDLLVAVHVARRLSSWLGDDNSKYLESFIIEEALLLWEKLHAKSLWVPEFKKWSKEERGMTAMFSDAVKFDDSLGNPLDYPRVPMRTMRHFFIDPMAYCPDAPDILSLPLMTLPPDRLPPSNEIPRLDPATCVCGECALIEDQMSRNLDTFGDQYFAVIDGASSRGCSAFESTWEPALREAEGWLESLLGRIATDFAAFPWTHDRRAGPAIIGIANKMQVAVGSPLTVEALLRLAVALRLSKVDADGQLFTTGVIMRPLPPSGLGYILTVPFAEDREDYHDSDDRVDRVVYAGGGWLDELAGSDITDTEGGIAILYPTDQLSIEYQTLNPGASNAMCMPFPTPDYPGLLPLSHTSENSTVVPRSDFSHNEDLTFHRTLITSNLKSDGFPLLSVAELNFPSPRGALATLIKLTLSNGRVVETAWKPTVHLGSECEHRNDHSRMTRCSPTSTELLLKIQLPDNDLEEELVRNRWDRDLLCGTEAADKKCRDVLGARLSEYQRRTVHLRERGSPLERHHACIIRCEGDDGPAEPIVILAASIGKKVYVIHYKECWSCALAGMQAQGCTIGIAKNTKIITSCDACQRT